MQTPLHPHFFSKSEQKSVVLIQTSNAIYITDKRYDVDIFSESDITPTHCLDFGCAANKEKSQVHEAI